MSKHASTAKVVDGSLVLSLPDAVTPVVMRLSLEEAKSAAFTVVEKQDAHILTVKFSDKDVREIAPFAEKDKAVSALMAASAALERGSRGYSAAVNDKEGMQVSFGGIAKWAFALIVLLGLVWVVTGMGRNLPQAPLSEGMKERAGLTTNSNNASTNTAKPFEDPRQVTGRSVSADEFLSRGQEQ